MAYFNRDTSNRSGRDNRGGGRGFGRSDNGPKEMFKTVCSSCGKECEVPFKPTNGKPVYCSSCFDRISPRTNDSRSERPERRGNFDRPQRDNYSDNRSQSPRTDSSKIQLDALNAKLDKIISLLTPKAQEVAPTAPVVEEVKEKKVVKTPRVKKAVAVKE